FRRRSDDDGLSGEIPAKAVPNPTDTVHEGAPVVSPRLPSTVSVSGPPMENAVPAAIDRARVALESARPTSAEYPSVAVAGPKAYPPSRATDPFPPSAPSGCDAPTVRFKRSVVHALSDAEAPSVDRPAPRTLALSPNDTVV